MSKLETNTIDTVSGTSTLQVGSTNTSTITLGVSGDTINVPSGVTINNNGTQTGFGETNTPGFHAFLSANQESLTDAATVKVNCNTERYDATGVYDNSSNYRFTPGVAGNYFIYGGVLLTADSTGNMREAEVYIYKNGSSIGKATFNYVDNYSQVATPTISIVDTADDDDYYELYAQVNTQNSSAFKILADTTQQRTYFGAYRIIGA
jgi:hypothetical protein